MSYWWWDFIGGLGLAGGVIAALDGEWVLLIPAVIFIVFATWRSSRRPL